MVTTRTKKVSLSYFASSIKVTLNEEAGQLRVMCPEGRPLTKTYVKVIGEESSGGFVFFKDGYTDLSGRFDYVSRSNSNLDSIKKFALFILSEEHGSVIKEANKPSGMSRVEAKVELVGQTWGLKAQDRINRVSSNYMAGKMKMATRK